MSKQFVDRLTKALRLRTILILAAVIWLSQLAYTSVIAQDTCGASECPKWCECSGGTCQPAPVQINAVRLKTRDGRYLTSVENPHGPNLLQATRPSTSVGPLQRETYLPTMYPWASGDSIVLEMSDMNWGHSNSLMRVDATSLPPTSPHSPIHGWQFGGPGAYVYVQDGCVSQPGCLGTQYSHGEWTFVIAKVGGGSIMTGDEVSLATVNGFYFRTESTQDGSFVLADSLTWGQADSVFVVEFGQVAPGLGWRPPVVQCQTCGKVTGTVTDASTGQPIADATVDAQGTNFKATTETDGRFALVDPALVDPVGRSCVPGGTWTLHTSANSYQTRDVGPVTVPAGGGVDVPIQLNCTNVSGKVINATGQPVARVSVFLVDSNGNPVVRPDGSLIEATTGADGTFIIRCVPHGQWGVWTDGANTIPISVPPEGLTNIVLTIGVGEPGCGDVIGTVTTDFMARPPWSRPISGATVKVIGTPPGQNLATTGADGSFRIQSVCPAGTRFLRTTASGFQPGRDTVNVPATGPSAPVDIKLEPIIYTPLYKIITIVLTWGTQPDDLDSHLSGPDGQGGQFHLYYHDLTPVDFVSLDHDVVTTQGPETVTVRRSPSASGAFVAGEYRYWVHNYSRSTFAGSNAIVQVFRDGVLLGQFAAASATGVPADDYWHVVNLQIDANGTVTLDAVQTFQNTTP
jgi:hypothetical protein